MSLSEDLIWKINCELQILCRQVAIKFDIFPDLQGDREQKPNVTLIDPAKQVEEYIKARRQQIDQSFFQQQCQKTMINYDS